jgi:hypothetical protein
VRFPPSGDQKCLGETCRDRSSGVDARDWCLLDLQLATYYYSNMKTSTLCLVLTPSSSRRDRFCLGSNCETAFETAFETALAWDCVWTGAGRSDLSTQGAVSKDGATFYFVGASLCCVRALAFPFSFKLLTIAVLMHMAKIRIKTVYQGDLRT